MGTTIKEVAKKAHVSTATVSRVFNNSGPVGEATRQRVMEISRKLHYTPNQAGRMLSTQRSDALGLLMPDLHGGFFSEVIRGMDLAAQKSHYHILVSSSHNHKDEIRGGIEMMRGRVDGLIIMSPDIDAHTLNNNLPKSLPVVLLNCFVDGDSFDSLNIDNYNGAYQVVRHLVEHGHKRIAMIKGKVKNYDASERTRGFRAAVRDLGLDLAYCYEAEGNFSGESGYSAMKKILEFSPHPTAVFAANDSMAIGAISALREQNIKVPGDIALVGFDDIPIAEFMLPPLSSVRVKISELGTLAVHRLVHAIREKNNHEKQKIIIPTTLVARESCGCAGQNTHVLISKNGKKEIVQIY
jgi:LacI family transcriptional regulator